MPDMAILVADLKTNEVQKRENLSSKKALPLALELYREYGRDSIVIAAPPLKALESSSTTSWTMVYYSEALGHMEFSYSTESHGASLASMGIEAVVIVGRSDRLKYLSIYPEAVEILPCEHMRTGSSASFSEIAAKTIGDLTISTGAAADKGVWFGSIQSNGQNLPFSGAGRAFHLHNLKGIAIKGMVDRRPAEEAKPKKTPRFQKSMEECGEYQYITAALRLGWAPIRYYSDRFDPRSYALDGKAFNEKFGSFSSSCSGCPYNCVRKKRDGSLLPSVEAVFSLSTNLGFFSPENAIVLAEACRQDGLEYATTGAILSYLSSLKPEEKSVYGVAGGTVGEYVALIHRLATGSVLYEGLGALPAALQGYDHRAFGSDLRGDFGGAVNASLGLPFPVDVLLLLPGRTPSPEGAAVTTLYSNLYTLGLLAMGLAPCRVLLEHWSRFPSFIYRCGFFSRLVGKTFSLGKVKGESILALGLELHDALELDWHGIPKHFIFDAESDKDSGTVPMRKLSDLYDQAKTRLEISLKSRSDKSTRREG